MNYITFNGCKEATHSFAKNGEGEINAYHVDGWLCEEAEFNLSDLLNDELPRVVNCPGCCKDTLNEGRSHTRLHRLPQAAHDQRDL